MYVGVGWTRGEGFWKCRELRCYLGHPWMVLRTMAKPWVEREYMRQVTNSKNE